MWNKVESDFSKRLMASVNDNDIYNTDDGDKDVYNAVMANRDRAKYLYRLSLIHPEHYGNVKIPDPMPQETATSKIHYEGTITPNATGKFVLVWDPMQNVIQLANNSTVDGQGNGTFTNINLNQNNTVVDMYRLVSASIRLRYYGEFNTHKGYLIGCTTSNVINATSNTFLTYQSVEDIQNKLIVQPIDGLKMIYTPADNQMLEFSSQTVYDNNTHASKWKKVLIIIGDSLPNTACIRYDVCRNIEYISRLSLREYIRHDKSPSCTYSADVIQDATNKEITTNSNIFGRMPTSKYPHLNLDPLTIGNIKDSLGIISQGVAVGQQIANTVGGLKGGL